MIAAKRQDEPPGVDDCDTKTKTRRNAARFISRSNSIRTLTHAYLRSAAPRLILYERLAVSTSISAWSLVG